jgi:hypothetical protein
MSHDTGKREREREGEREGGEMTKGVRTELSDVNKANESKPMK